MNETVRLSKLMASQGLCSRREADRLIAAGQVSVDGKVVAELGSKVDPNARIQLSKAAHRERQRLATVILNKPPGIVSNQPEKGYPEAVSLILAENRDDNGDERIRPVPPPYSLNVAGRLDIDSSGLLVLTQDGSIARLLISPDSTIEKEYRVRVKGQVSQRMLALLTHGLSLDGRALRPATIRKIQDDLLVFVLKEGRKRQIRRMCELVDLQVKTLTRTRIGQIRLGHLPRGRWRHLTQGETF
ncbi:MAG: pseudouridine synthase [Arenicellales bacterium]|jgi:23S rRNA pseudouridine2604 synthase|nr:rRNA pseudouridine synthase [Gammaproteobacteria bacterium]NDA14289.1 rRNA pseudouridine synthase [Gammaproteobacteria bacterium]NDG43746.1 rRNA pseudouridine synthase [Gammaproteobacteria bacterium]